MNHYVYQIKNLINNKIYVGKRSCDSEIVNDNYMGSGDLIKKAQSKHGMNSFTKKILKEFHTAQEAYDFEAKIVTNEFVRRIDTYNIALGGGTPQVPMDRIRKPFKDYEKAYKQEFKNIVDIYFIRIVRDFKCANDMGIEYSEWVKQIKNYRDLEYKKIIEQIRKKSNEEAYNIAFDFINDIATGLGYEETIIAEQRIDGILVPKVLNESPYYKRVAFVTKLFIQNSMKSVLHTAK